MQKMPIFFALFESRRRLFTCERKMLSERSFEENKVSKLIWRFLPWGISILGGIFVLSGVISATGRQETVPTKITTRELLNHAPVEARWVTIEDAHIDYGNMIRIFKRDERTGSESTGRYYALAGPNLIVELPENTAIAQQSVPIRGTLLKGVDLSSEAKRALVDNVGPIDFDDSYLVKIDDRPIQRHEAISVALIGILVLGAGIWWIRVRKQSAARMDLVGAARSGMEEGINKALNQTIEQGIREALTESRKKR